MAVVHLNQIDLARRWKISHRTLERWRWAGCGPCYVKIGGRVVYRIEDIEAFETERLCAAPQRNVPVATVCAAPTAPSTSEA